MGVEKHEVTFNTNIIKSQYYTEAWNPCNIGYRLYLKEAIALYDHMSQALRRCQVFIQIFLVWSPCGILLMHSPGDGGEKIVFRPADISG